MDIVITKSNTKGKKYTAVINDKKDNKTKTVSFGQSGASDYTKHKDPERKERYIARHKNGNENWTKSGVDTAGWLSRFILWEKPTLKGAVENANKKYGDIRFKIARELAV
jgi:hypothetical protein